MQPRLNSSKKWTSLPAELAQQIHEVFTEGFGMAVKNGEIIVDGRIYTNELMLRVGYLEKGRLAQVNFEVSLDFNAGKQNAMQAIQFAMDCSASMMEDYLKNPDEGISDFPKKWEMFDIAGKKVFLKVSTENEKIEAQANKILGEAIDEDDGLVKGEDEEEMRAQIFGILGVESDDHAGHSHSHAGHSHGHHSHGGVPCTGHDEADDSDKTGDGEGH